MHRLFISTVLGLVAVLGAAPSVLAADEGERLLSAAERRAAERRVADAERYLARADAQLTATASCPTPTAAGPGAIGPEACGVPASFLAVEARDQVKPHYCGPATGQVIANYSWAMGPGLNKFTQAKIAIWMKTDVNGLTNAPELEDGLELATQGSPRRPANWDWVVLELRDRNGNGVTGDELHSYIRSNVSGSRMPLAIPVKPHQDGAQFHLVSWPNPVASVGHWIAVYGWFDLFDGDDGARTYYTDSSRDEGGSTGKFWDPTRHIAGMIMAHTRRIVW
jgi:hypothetical protein